jgi:peptide deformylase
MIFRGKQLIFRQMTQVLTIIQLGNLILQQKAPAIDNFLDSDCQNLIDSLITTVQAAYGVGIAAPQVARSLRLFIALFTPLLVIPTLLVIWVITYQVESSGTVSLSVVIFQYCISLLFP